MSCNCDFQSLGRFTSNKKWLGKWFGICYTFGSVFMAVLISYVTLIWIYEHFSLLAVIAIILIHLGNMVLVVT